MRKRRAIRLLFERYRLEKAVHDYLCGPIIRYGNDRWGSNELARKPCRLQAKTEVEG